MSFKGPIRKMVADFMTREDFDVPKQPRDGDHFSDRPLLKRGAKGPAVTELQGLLRSVGFDIVVDGAFGKNTQTAVRAFQKTRGLGVDGKVGSETWAALLASGR